jgi:DNA-binding Lrp family transcriptional regulator
MGEALGATEEEVLAALRRLAERRVLARVGAVLAPRRLGFSTLAALAVPPERLDEVAALVSHEPAVNHNYEREHRYNLWFVVAGADRDAVEAALRRIEAATGLTPLVLPLEEAYRLDLGFPLQWT